MSALVRSSDAVKFFSPQVTREQASCLGAWTQPPALPVPRPFPRLLPLVEVRILQLSGQRWPPQLPSNTSPGLSDSGALRFGDQQRQRRKPL